MHVYRCKWIDYGYFGKSSPSMALIQVSELLQFTENTYHQIGKNGGRKQTLKTYMFPGICTNYPLVHWTTERNFCRYLIIIQ